MRPRGGRVANQTQQLTPARAIGAAKSPSTAYWTARAVQRQASRRILASGQCYDRDDSRQPRSEPRSNVVE